METALFHLHAPSAPQAIPALTMGQGLPKERNGLPAFYFWRKSIRDGRFRHPVKGFEVEVTPQRRRAWELAFRSMRDNGEDVPVVRDHSEKADDLLGYVVDVRQNGEWLEELHQYLGETARDVALRNKISVGIHPAYTDGRGRKYGDAVIHSAITPRPVVGDTGGAEAVPVAASCGLASGDLFVLAAPQEPPTKEPHMDNNVLMQRIQTLGARPDVPDPVEWLLSYAETLAPLAESANACSAELSAARAELSAARQQVQTLSAAANPRPVDPDILRDRADLTLGRIDLAVDRGDIPAHFADKLKTAIQGKDGQPNAFLLSHSQDIGGRPVDFFLQLCQGAGFGVRKGEQTLSQAQPVARVTPGANGGETIEQQIAAGMASAKAYQDQMLAGMGKQ